MANPLDIKGIMAKALERLAKQYSVTPDQVAVKIFINPETNLLAFQLFISGASVFIEGRNNGLMSFNQDILNQKIDLMNREAILNQLILPPAMAKFATELNCTPYDVFIMVGTVNNETCNPYLYLYKGENEAVRQVFIETDF
jgi:hypothetical protein